MSNCDNCIRGKNDPMESLKIKRAIVALFMESPHYFTIPLKKRHKFIIFFSQKVVYDHICVSNEPQVKRNRV
jgi:hypothetical protein